MTEAEYRSLAEFRGLPLYDADDPRCESIDRANGDPSFTGSVFEADDLTTAQDYVRRADLVPKGGTRHTENDEVAVYAYFWQKRS